MKLGKRRLVVGAVATAVWLLAVVPASAQREAEEKPLMSEQVFKNVQVLKGIPVTEFMATMGFFSASLGLNCTSCHIPESLESWEKYGDDSVALKRTARRMVQMVDAINKANFGGARAVSCYSCHRGGSRPKVIPSLAEQYSTPPPEDPNEVEIVRQGLAGPSAEQILDKYIQALGGSERVAKLTSFVAKGTYGGYDTDFLKAPLEIYAKAPMQRTTSAHTPIGDSTTVYDGHAGWIAGFDKPLPLLAVPAGGDLDGMRLDAALSFPANIRQALSDWRSGFPPATINDHEAHVVQGKSPGGSRVKLFFDSESGLLVRQVRYSTTMVGIVPTQVDYSDYREVAGVKVPFHWTITWTDGQSTVELSEVQPNVAIEPAKFGRPAPAALRPKPAAR